MQKIQNIIINSLKAYFSTQTSLPLQVFYDQKDPTVAQKQLERQLNSKVRGFKSSILHILRSVKAAPNVLCVTRKYAKVLQ